MWKARSEVSQVELVGELLATVAQPTTFPTLLIGVHGLAGILVRTPTALEVLRFDFDGHAVWS